MCSTICMICVISAMSKQTSKFKHAQYLGAYASPMRPQERHTSDHSLVHM